MRSDLIYNALGTVENRYLLCQLASKATRMFHKPNTRIQETTNDVLTHFGKAPRTRVIDPEFEPIEVPQRRAA